MSVDMEGMVVGQDEAILKVVKAIQRNRVGLKDPEEAHRHFYFPWPDRCWENRTGQGAGTLYVRFGRFA